MRLSCPEQMLASHPVDARVGLIQESGFDGIDCRFSTLEDPHAARKIRESGLPLASVYSQVRAPSLLDAAAADRARAVADVVHRARTAAAHGADNLILVPVFGEPRIALDSTPEAQIELEAAILFVSLKEIAEELVDVPIAVVIEPLNHGETHFLTNPTTAASICSRVQDPRIATMVDTYHCYQEKLDIPEQIRGVGEHLALVHVSDSARGLPGEGEIDFSSVVTTLAAVNYIGWIGLECRQVASPDDEKDLADAVARLRSLEHLN
jgi:D-psicose/D-tagatose/L-ribulose 3-epimerase